MPGFRGHLAGGVVFGFAGVFASVWYGIFSYQTQPMLLAGLLGFCLLGALFPDVDTDSIGQRFFYLIMVVIDIGLIYMGQYQWAAWLGLFSMLPALDKHRGWTHSWWAMFVVPLPILAVTYFEKLPISYVGGMDWYKYLPFYCAFVLGYFSHLLLDGIKLPQRG
ncbi:MAG: metal-dependent hydrolase [Desulfovibrio sp.]